MKFYKIISFLHRSGTSKKTGRPYDFYEVHSTIPDERYSGGLRTASHTINGDRFESAGLALGSEYILTDTGEVFVP